MEGSEPFVIAGASQTLEKFRPVIWVEVNQASLQVAHRSFDDIAAPLRRLRYRLYMVAPTRHFGRLRHSLLPIGSSLPALSDVIGVPEGCRRFVTIGAD